MKILVEVLLFAQGAKARLYSIRMPAQPHPETTRFFHRMMGLPRYLSDKRFGTAVRTLLDWLDRIARLEGALERSFRPREGRGLALPSDKGPLRR